jgi:hypothetical protein
VGKRLCVIVITLGLILWSAFTSLQAEEATIFQVFFWLLLVLAASGVALWPAANVDQRAELKLERLGWADRIEFAQSTKPSAAAADQRPTRDKSLSTGTT